MGDLSFGDILLSTLWFMLVFAWIWLMVSILTDLFRDPSVSGWGKAAWIIFLIFIPFLSALVYLIARGHGMRERTIKAAAEEKQHFDSYVRQQAHSSPADELHKLAEMKEKGALSAEEFERAKAKLLA